MDNKKIYYLISSDYAVCHDKEYGPCFGEGYDIGIKGNPITENVLYTYQAGFDYKGDEQSLSEYNNRSQLKAIDYEIFQIILA